MFDPRYSLAWTEWTSLLGASRNPSIPRTPGLYRIRRVGREDLDYIGQTGRSLRGRLGMLGGVYGEEMPYADPHTAAPALWALRHATGCEFEVSVATEEGSTPWRKGLEALTIALYRQERGRSPTVEFGRMPPGYRPSSGNNARLVARGLRIRGGLSAVPDKRHEAGIAPFGRLEGDPHGADWGGHDWTAWTPLQNMAGRAVERGSGLYRVRGSDPKALLYVGQGRVPERLIAHFRKTADAGHPLGRIFAEQDHLECSWTINELWLDHQRLELENDLIAAHVLKTGMVPAAQFIG